MADRIRRAAFWAVAALLVMVGSTSLALSIGDLGRTFPGFPLATDRSVPFTLVSSWTGAKAGLRTTDRILAVDGRPASTGGAVMAAARAAPAGTVIRYDVERVDAADRRTRLTLDVPTQRFGLADWFLSAFMFFLTGLVYLVLGAVVSILRPGVPVTRAHLAFSWTAALAYMTVYLQAMACGVPAWANTISGVALGAATVHLSLMLPRRLGGTRHAYLQGANVAAWALVACVLLWALAADRFRILTYVGPWSLALAANLVLLGNLVWTATDRRSTAAERAQGAIIGVGLTLALAGGLLMVMEGSSTFPLPVWSGLAAQILMFGTPAGIAAAIVYSRLFAIEVPIRRSLTYGLLAASLTILYLLVVGGLGALGGAAGLNQVAGTLLVAAFVLPLRDRIREWLDRALFRADYDPMEVVNRFAARSRRATDPDALADTLRDLVQECLAPEWVRIAPETGAIAIGPRKSGLPNSAEDRRLLAALADHFALWLDVYRHVDAVRSREAERDAARQTEARERAFVGLVSHELRTPLSTISLAAHSMSMDEALDPPGRANLVELIRRAAGDLTRFAEDLLDAAQLEAGAFKLRRERFDLVDIAREAASELRPLVDADGQELRVETPAEPVPLLGDRQRVMQVFRNLLHNATKFTPTGGSIRLSIRLEGDLAVAEFADSGPGLSAQELDRAFSRFGRGDRLDGHGTGLGLYIAKELVEAHGGSIAVASAPGRGATFAVRLPLAGNAAGDAALVPLAAEAATD
ncbi:MAG: hypothetical protein FJZ01_17580 [Candidatus Sericytochromatia bacterium]|nr:hypothetical protein [Candidatus Tanganyikabacteria bacterium]